MSEKEQTSHKQLDPVAITRMSLKLYRKYFWQVLVFGTLPILLNISIGWLDPNKNFFVLAEVLTFIFSALLDAVFLLWVYQKEKHPQVRFATVVKEVFQRGVPVVLNHLVGSLILFIGALLLVVPALIWGTIFSQAFSYTVFEKKGVKEAFLSSRTLTKGRRMSIFISYAYVWVPFITLLLIEAWVLGRDQDIHMIVYSATSILLSFLLVLQSYSVWKTLRNHV